jgi:hypothetical protein
MSSDSSSKNYRAVNRERPAMARTIDLYGRAPDGRWIKSGHYVIDHNGDAIVVHSGNVRDESVSVQFMHDELTPL